MDAGRVSYRLAEAADADQIAALHAASWRRAYRGMFSDEFLDGDIAANRLEVWRDRLSRPTDNQFVCVAIVADEIIGFVCAYSGTHSEWGSLIDNLHVVPAMQRHRIGVALMREAARWLEPRDERAAVHLWVLEANHPARRFYERLGAIYAETRRKENPGGGTAEYCRYTWARPDLITKTCAAGGAAPSDPPATS